MTANNAPSQPVSGGGISKKNKKHGPRAGHQCPVRPPRNPVKKVIADYVAGAISTLTGISVGQTMYQVQVTRVDEMTMHLHVQDGGETHEYVVKVSERAGIS
jgi:hypothetical protein